MNRRDLLRAALAGAVAGWARLLPMPEAPSGAVAGPFIWNCTVQRMERLVPLDLGDLKAAGAFDLDLEVELVEVAPWFYEWMRSARRQL